MSTATDLDAFHAILDFSSSEADNPNALMSRTTDLVSAIEWGLFDGPEMVDRSYLPLVSGGVKGLIKDLGNIAQPYQEEEASPESEYAIYKLCDWRAQSRDIIGSWLFGWWTQDGGDEAEKPSLLAGFGDGLRVLQFGGWWAWRFYISPSGIRFRKQCQSVEIVPPPTPAEEPDQPPLPFDSPEERQTYQTQD